MAVGGGGGGGEVWRLFVVEVVTRRSGDENRGHHYCTD